MIANVDRVDIVGGTVKNMIKQKYLTRYFLALTSICLLFTVGRAAGPAGPSTELVETWFTHHKGRVDYQLSSRSGARASSWIEVERSSGEFHIWKGMGDSKIAGRPSDFYSVTYKRYQATPPYALLGVMSYELLNGQARAGAWRSQSGGQWVILNDAKVLVRSARKSERDGVSIARRLWSRTDLKPTPLPCQETLYTELGLGYQDAPREKKISKKTVLFITFSHFIHFTYLKI